MIASPLAAGAVQETSADASLRVADTFVGASGALAGVTALDAAEAADVPTAFEPVTVKVYDVPLVKPETTQESVPRVVQVSPPGDDVTV